MLEPKTNIEKLFVAIDESAELLKEELDITYLEALADAGENLFQGEVVQEISSATKKQLESRLAQIDFEVLHKEEVRKALQLAVLKGMKEATQPNHALTPDTVAIFISYLVNKITSKKEEVTIGDPAVGTGNLLTAVLNGLQKKKVKSYGLEADETLLHLAFVSANLQEQQIELYHQDSIRPLSLAPVDVILSDLPVGYYPNEEIAFQYELKAKEGRSFVHHLMIEKSVELTKENGYLIFLIPNFLFESDQAPALNAYLKEKTIILGLLQLPQTMFKNAQHGKSILILQKKGDEAVQPRQALLADMPSFSRQDALADMLKQIDRWFEEELNIS
ncbi:class I SAM-dependent methyltransferase [Alkalihalobacterium alkalinitrilicum]|uniref:class I SAM-dependent methyltransferase n=1 Tax=Alkalihalobacterium alkalinitrilicum TaxID=427920 RepID=UPI0009956989|nr:class I SAM-dependent methyltransferase [Alkalihalobacterium alkalinitrilicum]